MPLQWIHIVCGKTAEGTHKGFSCVDLPYVGIAAIFWPPNCITLGAGPWVTPPPHHYTITTTGWSPKFSVLIFFSPAMVLVAHQLERQTVVVVVSVSSPPSDDAGAVAGLPLLPPLLPLQTRPSHPPHSCGLQQLFSLLKIVSIFNVRHVDIAL